MQKLSRRSFLKATFAGVAILTVKRIKLPSIQTNGELSLEVDEAGNAVLHGVKTNMDERGNIRLRRKAMV